MPRWMTTPLLLALPFLAIAPFATAQDADTPTGAVESATTIAAGDGDIPVERYRTDGDAVLLWFPSEHGVQDGHRDQALALQAAGIEVWLVDPFTGHFLPEAASSFNEMPLATVPDLIEAAHDDTDRPLFVFGHDRAMPWLLTGLYQWQQAHPEAGHLAGLLMASPYLHTGADTDAAELQAIVELTNLPVYILQPALSPQRQHLGRIQVGLSAGGSSVGARLLPEIRDRFFFRPDATAEERLASETFHREIVFGMDLLTRLPHQRVPAVAAAGTDLTVRTPSGSDAQLNTLDEPVDAPPLEHPDLAGDLQRLEDYRGEVILVNFWASWCPPCVHEMPSMQRLEDELREVGFRILAVNLGEDEDTIQRFIEDEVQTDFTILLDPEQNSLDEWRAMAFPTSYVIDRQGRLRYYLFGAIEWMETGVIEQIRELLDEEA